MKKVTLIFLCCVLAFTGCSKLSRGKRAFRKGEYKKAQMMLEEYVKVYASNQGARKYLVLVQSGIVADSAAQLIKAKEYEAAIPLLDHAIGLNENNEDAKILLNTTLDDLTQKIDKDFVPNKTWGKALSAANIVLKYRPDDKVVLPAYAMAVFESERAVFTANAVLAIKKAYAAFPDNAFLKEKMEKIAGESRPFEAFFKDYEKILLTANYRGWRNVITARFAKEAENDVKRLKDKGDKVVTNVESYFKIIAKDPEKNGSPDGAEIVCVEPLSASRAYVHFTYANLPKVLKMEITGSGSGMKIDREEDSELHK